MPKSGRGRGRQQRGRGSRGGRGRAKHSGRGGHSRNRGRGSGTGRRGRRRRDSTNDGSWGIDESLWNNAERYEVIEDSEDEGVDFEFAAQGGLLDSRPPEEEDDLDNDHDNEVFSGLADEGQQDEREGDKGETYNNQSFGKSAEDRVGASDRKKVVQGERKSVKLKELVADFSNLAKVLESVPLYLALGADPTAMGIKAEDVVDESAYLPDHEEEESVTYKTILEDLQEKYAADPDKMLREPNLNRVSSTKPVLEKEPSGPSLVSTEAAFLNNSSDSDDFDQWLDQA